MRRNGRHGGAALATEGGQYSTVNYAIVFLTVVAGFAAGGLGNLAANTLPGRKEVGDPTGAKLARRTWLLYLVMVIVFGLTAWRFAPNPVQIAVAWLYGAFLLTVLVIDFEHRRVLNVMLVPAAVIALVLSVLPQTPTPESALIGGAVGLGLFVGVYLLSRGHQVTVIISTLLHRSSHSGSAPWQDILLAWGGTLLPLAMQSTAFFPNAIGSLLVLVGVLLATGAVLSLGRSFGIEAANRGTQTHGLYRFVRHPIYAAYLPLIGGYLLAYPSVWNALVVAGWLLCQVARINREETVLSQDAQYQAYAGRVRWRLIPRVW